VAADPASRGLFRATLYGVPLVVLLLTAAFGSALGLPVGARLYDYQWRDARFCDDCHAHDYASEGWARSVHYGLTTCHDCHRVPISHYPKNLWKMIVAKPETMEDIHRPHVATVVCEQCHSEHGAEEELSGPMPETLRRRVVKVGESPLHKMHLEARTRKPGRYRGEAGDDTRANGSAGHGPRGREASGDDSAEDPHVPEADAGKVNCMDCHGSESNRGHRFESTQETCLACHEGQRPTHDRLSAVSCRDCHFAGFTVLAAAGPAKAATR